MSFKEQIMSKDYLWIFLKRNGCYCVHYPSNIFLQGHILGDLFSKLLNAKVFSFIHFNNLLGIKTKCANVNHKGLKLGNITWGISSDIPQFWLHHVTCLDQSHT